ncbi:uncharacterized protein LOC132716051 [Ruditapes philippinarum]|uniref:uncharacterized protein LOC132716051 n=1 Tax=Ruditapes philippinarum TaxID=129788 RepID=UPI00295BC3EB|nr:uncharacterized protein LOC132716051 [Ruditapes philippinarum]
MGGWGSFIYFLLFIIVLIPCVISKDAVIEYHEDTKPCTYFGNTRVAKAEGGLVNCSWYSHNACCKRTEVTSVFSNMLPLYMASKDCRNHINYMMCYFCSPDQYHWYKDGKVNVCEKFCQSVYSSCKDAFYNGTRIGESYKNGTSFCETQNFKVVNSKYCFKYDPTVFDAATSLQQSDLLLCFLTISAFFTRFIVDLL